MSTKLPINRLLLAGLLLVGSEEYGDPGTTQKKDVKKTPPKILPSTVSKHCMNIFVVNNHGKQI